MRRYLVTRTGRSARPTDPNKIYYPGRDAYGLSADDSRAMGIEYVAISEHESGVPCFTIPKEDLLDVTNARIVCAAVRLGDGLIIPGPRHWDNVMHRVATALHNRSPMDFAAADQGFIDQFGIFHNRREAAAIAHRAGQANVPELFSEDLY